MNARLGEHATVVARADPILSHALLLCGFAREWSDSFLDEAVVTCARELETGIRSAFASGDSERVVEWISANDACVARLERELDVAIRTAPRLRPPERFGYAGRLSKPTVIDAVDRARLLAQLDDWELHVASRPRWAALLNEFRLSGAQCAGRVGAPC